jgi:tRNA G46 methylase TrmB
MTWQGNWVKNQQPFQNAKRVLEIVAGAFDTTIFLAERNPDKEFYGLDFTLIPALGGRDSRGLSLSALA